jgi:predicted metalloprotease
MWHLKMAKHGGEWMTVDNFETVARATKKIQQLEGYDFYGVFFEVYIETGPGAHSEQESLGHLEHVGKNTGSCYVVKRAQH